jgi:hypothetical protein
VTAQGNIILLPDDSIQEKLDKLLAQVEEFTTPRCVLLHRAAQPVLLLAESLGTLSMPGYDKRHICGLQQNPTRLQTPGVGAE